MKKVKLSEESYNKLKNRLVNESSFGNDDLANLCHELKMSISDASQVVRDHIIMCNRLGQEPNPNVIEIKNHIDAIEPLLEQIS